MSIAISAQGTLLKISNNGSTPTYNTIPECAKINAPTTKFDLVDVTSHDSTGGWREYLPGLADGENCTADFFFVPTDTIHTQLYTDAYAKTLDAFKCVFPGSGSGLTMAFNAYIVGLQPVADVGQALKSTLTAKVTGQPTWS